MPSTGLMIAGGIGNALSQGVDTFLKVRGMKQEQEADRQRLGLLAAKENMELNPETGEYGLNQFGLSQQEGLLTKQAADADLAAAHAEAYRAAAKKSNTAAAAPPKPSIGQQALDREYGKQFAKRTAEGGYADAQKGIAQIDSAISRLGKTDRATGGLIGLVPKKIRDFAAPESADIQDTVEEVVQRNLRQVLGAQFTEGEGNRLIARAYNPRLSEKQNIERLGRLKTQMAQAIALQQAADEYFDTNGTLKGFQGKLYQSADDFDFGDKQPAAGGDWDDAKEKRLQELRAKVKK